MSELIKRYTARSLKQLHTRQEGIVSTINELNLELTEKETQLALTQKQIKELEEFSLAQYGEIVTEQVEE